MTDYSYHDLKNLITRNVQESYCILPIRYGGMEMIAIKKPETKHRWWHQSCTGSISNPNNLEKFPISALFDPYNLLRVAIDPSLVDISCSSEGVINSILYDTTGGLWYDHDNPQSHTGRGGTTEFIFLKKNPDTSYSVTYLDNVAYYIDFTTCVVARNLLLRIYDYARDNSLDIHHPDFVRVSKVPPQIRRGE